LPNIKVKIFFLFIDLYVALGPTVHVARGVYLTLHALDTFELTRTHASATCPTILLSYILAFALSLSVSMSLFRHLFLSCTGLRFADKFL